MLKWLIDGSGFVPRAQCGTGWSDSLIAWHHVGNVLTCTAYFAIPVVFLIGWRWIRSQTSALHGFPQWSLVAFAVFIFFCGLGHLFDVVVFYWAPYRLTTLLRTLTGVASWVGFFGGLAAVRWLVHRYGELEEQKAKAFAATRDALDDATRSLELAQAARDQQGDRLAASDQLVARLVQQLDQYRADADDSASHQVLMARLDKLRS